MNSEFHAHRFGEKKNRRRQHLRPKVKKVECKRSFALKTGLKMIFRVNMHIHVHVLITETLRYLAKSKINKCTRGTKWLAY